jgi:hypothetical protein
MVSRSQQFNYQPGGCKVSRRIHLQAVAGYGIEWQQRIDRAMDLWFNSVQRG